MRAHSRLLFFSIFFLKIMQRWAAGQMDSARRIGVCDSKGDPYDARPPQQAPAGARHLDVPCPTTSHMSGGGCTGSRGYESQLTLVART